MSENKFEWTDELVKEYTRNNFSDLTDHPLMLNRFEHFKKSKAIQRDIPKPLNYEIVNYKDNKSGYILVVRGTLYQDFVLQEHISINAVRRISDNEVFSVGDIIDTVGYDGYPSQPLKRFFLKENVLYVQFDEGKGSNDGCMGFNAIQKVKPKVPLFTTEDGVEVHYSKERIWEVFSNWCIGTIPINILVDHKNSPEGVKFFSTEEKAKEYIFNNKPIQVSYKEFLEAYNKQPNYTMTRDFFKDFFKSKINP